jgi:glutamate dehydrogenase
MAPDRLAPAHDPAREEVFTAAAAALRRLAPAVPPAAQALLARLYATLPTAELAARGAEPLAEAALSLYGLAARRTPGEPLCRVLPPGPGRGAHPVAEIVADDMPFLVDSALATLTLHGRTVRQLLHPVLPARRDAAGALLALGEAEGARAESMMRIELGPRGVWLPGTAASAEAPAALEAALAATLRDVRAAVTAFPQMLERLRTAEAELAAEPEAVAFLRWLADDNFVLLGHRLLRVEPDGFLPEDGLGLLASPALSVFDALRDPRAVPAAVREAVLRAGPLTVLKANWRATVHRPQHADVIATTQRDAAGRVVAVRFFLGLFAASAYNRNPRSIPWLGRKVERLLAMAGHAPDQHDGRALRNILDTWPRDELFQAAEADILDGARLALDLTVRPRAALAVRRDPFERFVSVIAWLPRDTFDTRLREQIGGMLARAFAGRLSAFYIALGDSPLARIHYVIGTRPGEAAQPDLATLEQLIAEVSRPFGERLAEALARDAGEAEATTLAAEWANAFPAAHRESASATRAVADLRLAQAALAAGRPQAELSREVGDGKRHVTLRIASPGAALTLADALPLFDSLGLRAIEETPHRLTPASGGLVVLHVFHLNARADCDAARFPALLAALDALLAGEAEADGFNRLVLFAGLSWRECWLLRAMFRWLKQVGFGFAQDSVEAALAAHADAARILIDLFHARFDPTRPRDAAAEEELDAAWRTLLETVANPDEDRILVRLRTLLDAVLRSNFHAFRPYLALKIDSAAAGEMPAPRPWREIFVHAVTMEGCHLRAGPVARGGIRWSDRREDFRTEILGLMKAQRLKNVIIVPTGAKGGFVLKGAAPETREALQEAGIAAYRTLVRGMLDLTDNLRGPEVVPPAGVVRRDADDAYIVAAADKGTATFSDIANALSAEYGFWLGDAFASGGSAGYDHKAMGITARGAWVMIARHFAELGHDIMRENFTVAGVGDMSGDVFGNGLLVSRCARLVAAFDHRHIFLDPDPDPEASYAERARLFAKPRSSWADYDPQRISPGGGVFPRNAKTVPLSPQARALLGLAGERPSPAEVMQAILRLRVDLLYFGGIGTYVKSSGERHAEVGDRANDPIRVDGRELRARVVGEGANLGVTQAGRIEAALGGVRINSDALDNSAGVSTSDHEVNIKILLADAEAEGRMTRQQRDALLREMTDEVAALVLADNAEQSRAVTLEERGAAEALAAHAALMARLEEERLLDRAQAGLPDAAALAARAASGQGLTRPEIAALLPFAKLWLGDSVGASALPDDEALRPLLLAYFPAVLREHHAEPIARHRLRRELLATALANRTANQLGPAGIARLAAGRDAVQVARATWLAGALLGIPEAAAEADAAAAPIEARLETQLRLRRLHEATARELLGEQRPLGAALAALAPGVGALSAAERTRSAGEPVAARLIAAGIPRAAATLAAAPPALAAAPAIVGLALGAGAAVEHAAAAWTELGESLGFDALRQAVPGAAAGGAFATRARAAALEDLGAAQQQLAQHRIAGRPIAEAGAAALAREAAASGELTAMQFAIRALARLA